VSKTEAEIANLDALISLLPVSDRELFERIYEVSVTKGRLNTPPSMEPWIEKHFGSVEKALAQRVVRVTNLVTLEEALFNELRAHRPEGKSPAQKPRVTKPQAHQSDLFHDPLTATPEDTFGRIEGRYCVTGSNVAKYEGYHSVIIFREPDPLRFTREHIVDYIDTGWRWARKAHAVDPEARYYFFMWNCGARAGASISHGHAQVMLSRRRHYAGIELLRRAAISYRENFGVNYFDDLYHAHKALGCGLEKDGVRIMAYLTPIKEKEVFLMAPEISLSLAERLYEVLACFRDRMGVVSFNVALLLPPIAPVDEDWDGFPAIARLVDRGHPASRASDIGTMELYASSVISSDPFEVARIVGEALPGGN